MSTTRTPRKPKERPTGDMAAAMAALGFTTHTLPGDDGSHGKPIHVLEGTLDSVRRYVDAIDANRLPFASDTGWKHAKHYIKGNDQKSVDFFGGTAKEFRGNLRGETNMTVFEQERDRLQRSGLLDRVQEALAIVNPRRRLKLSDEDGDYEHDRRFDDRPFLGMSKRPTAARTLDIECHFAANYRVGADNITRFGVLCWALVDLLEAAGITCRVTYCKRNWGIGGDEASTQINTVLKEAGQYVAPSLLAAGFDSMFYRRANWSLIGTTVDMHGHTRKSDTDVGGAWAPANPCTFAAGKLILCNDVAGNVAAVEKAIFQAIGFDPAAFAA